MHALLRPVDAFALRRYVARVTVARVTSLSQILRSPAEARICSEMNGARLA
jgi:hypothetical protein